MKRNLLLKLWVFAFLAVFSAKTFGQQFTEQSITGLPTTIGWSTSTWADFNNDGKLDILVTGQVATGTYITKLYKNTGNNTFTEVPQSFVGVVSSAVAWGDYNNDGFLDLVITGYANQSSYPATAPVTLLYKNNGDETFTLQTSAVFTGVALGSVIWGDYNKDGKLDLLISGRTDNSLAGTGSGTSKTTKLYKNNGDGTFTEQSQLGLTASLMTALSFNDYNNDGNPDINIMGYASVRSAYKNLGNETFAAVATNGIPNSRGGFWAWGDYNNDGYMDFVTSYNGTSSGYVAKFEVWKGSQAGTYSYVSSLTPLIGVNYEQAYRDGSVCLGDYDNDGNLDILATGFNSNGEFIAKVYKNSGAPNYTFTEQTDITLTGVRAGNGVFGDYDGDGKLDILIVGSTTPNTDNSTGVIKIYKNVLATANTAPSKPVIVSSTPTVKNQAVLIFSKATDTQTPQASLTYNLRIGTTSHGVDILSPASRADGSTLLPSFGNITVRDPSPTTLNISDTIKYLHGGKYYWSVQSVDGAFMGSNWSDESSFVIPSVTPTTQSSTTTFANTTSTGTDISWTNGNGFKRIVFISENTSGSPTLTSNQTYTANSVFGQGSTAGNGWYCIYNGSGSNVSVSGLTEKTNYKVVVFEYDGYPGYENYNTTEATNAGTFNTPFTITTQASSIVVLAASYSFDVSWTNGDGAKRAVFISLGNTGTPTVNDGQTYTANAKFGQGSAAGTGWYCVYNGTGSSTTITGLSINTEYILAVYEYNGDPGKERYLTSTALDNPFSKFTSNKLNQIITFDPLASKTTLDASFTLSATGGDSGNPIVYTSSNTNVATISGNTVTIVGAGTTDITATQAGSTGYSDATPVIRTLTVNKVAQAINFAALPTNIKYLDPAFQVSATGGASGNPVVFTSSDPTKATVSGNTVTIVGGGSVDIIANQTGDAIYADAPEVRRTLTIAKLPQVIGFDNLPDKTYLNAPFTLTATGGDSGNPVTYSSSNAAVATISNNICTITGAGSVNITASQAGNNNYEAATNVVRSLKVNQATQSITFDLLPVMNANDGTLTLTATASSGLPITYTSSDLLVATISGNTVTIKKAGTINITAAQAGNTSFKAATSSVRALVINKLSQTLTFDALATKLPTETDFQLNAAVTSGRKITYTSSNPNVATIVGANMDYVHIVGNGTTFITASQPGDSIYLAALPIQHVFMVGTTGVKELSEKEVSIFPNPVSETLNVNFAKSMAQTTISIYSNNGQQLTSVNADQTANVIYMGNLAKGTYILKIVSPDGTLVKQIIKK